jgi:hypothetical protein
MTITEKEWAFISRFTNREMEKQLTNLLKVKYLAMEQDRVFTVKKIMRTKQEG